MFIKNARWQQKTHLRVHIMLLVAASLFLVSPSLSATTEPVIVDCNMQPDGISQALATLDVVGPHHILVSGPCVDFVHISNRDRVTIEGNPALGGATISAPGDFATPVFVSSSRIIELFNLVIDAGGFSTDNLVTISNSDVAINDCTIEGSTRQGIVLTDNSFVNISNTTIQNNGSNGLVINNGSTVTLGFGTGVNVINNSFAFPLGRAGIRVDNGSLRVEGNLTVDSNGRDGLLLLMGSRVNINSNSGPNSFSNNSNSGVSVQTGSTISFSGDNTISDNGRQGILVIEGGTARFIFGSAVIERNARWGVFVAADSGARFLLGTHQIRFNGVPEFGGGVLVANNSSFIAQTGTNISDNIGIGVTVDIDASTSFQGTTINNNSEEGVFLSHIAVAEFFSTLTTISGNGIADLACDNTSLVFGDLTGIVDNTCDSFLDLIASISDQVQAIVASAPGSPLADKVEDVRDKFQVAVVELNKTPPDNQAAVGNIEGAVGDVQAAVDDGVLDPALGDLLMDQLAGVAKQIASNAIEQATAGGGDSDKITDAVMARADGDALLASPTYMDAVNKYKDAVAIAEGA